MNFCQSLGVKTGLGRVGCITRGLSLHNTKLPRLLRPAATACLSSSSTPGERPVSAEIRKEEGVVVIGLNGLVVVVGEAVEECTGLDWLVVLPFQTPPVGSLSTALDLTSSLKIAVSASVAASVTVGLSVLTRASLGELVTVLDLVGIGLDADVVEVVCVDTAMVEEADRIVV